MTSFLTTRVSPRVIISIFFVVVLVGLLVGWFLLQAVSLNDQIGACSGQGGTPYEKTDADSCPNGHFQLWENQNIYCCIALEGA